MARAAASPVDQQLLTFRVAGEHFALPASDVSEVIRPPAVTRVPLSPLGLSGVANLRGAVLPIVSLRTVLGTGTGDHAFEPARHRGQPRNPDGLGGRRGYCPDDIREGQRGRGRVEGRQKGQTGSHPSPRPRQRSRPDLRRCEPARAICTSERRGASLAASERLLATSCRSSASRSANRITLCRWIG